MSESVNYTCPRGHQSTELDYCSECGAKMDAVRAPAPALAPAPAMPTVPGSAGDLCPDCGTAREARDAVFCEICGFNFVSGAHGQLPVPDAPVLNTPVLNMPVPDAPVPAASADPALPPAAQGSTQLTQTETPPPARWTLEVALDASLREPGSPEPPAGVGPFRFVLAAPVSLIGRRSEARAIFPEIPLDFDEAVSRRHALLQLAPDGRLTLRDIGAANGTRLNGSLVAPLTDQALNPGDTITLGHWTRITVGAI